MAFVPKFLVVQIIWSYRTISYQKLFSFKGHKVNSFVGLMGKRSQEEPGKLNSPYRKLCTSGLFLTRNKTRQGSVSKADSLFSPQNPTSGAQYRHTTGAARKSSSFPPAPYLTTPYPQEGVGMLNMFSLTV